MIKKSLISLGIFICIFMLLTPFFTEQNETNILFSASKHERDNESPPENITSTKEQRLIDAYAEELAQERLLQKRDVGSGAYADGLLNGSWQQKEFTLSKGSKHGYRTIFSTYDAINDKIYVVTDAGHLYRIDRDEDNPNNTTWKLRNAYQKFMSTRTKKSLEVMHEKDGSPILVRAYDKKMQYSEDEGITWNNTNGVNFSNTYDKSVVIQGNEGEKLIALVNINNRWRAVSSTNGKNYSSLNYDIPFDEYQVQIFSPTNSQAIYIIATSKSDNNIIIHRMLENQDQFVEIQNFVNSEITGIKRAFGTRTPDGKFHFYIAHKNNIYYSDDEGQNWQTTHSESFTDTAGDRVSRTVHPSNPEIIFRGYLDLYISTDKGTNFDKTKHFVGWDLHDLKMFTKEDGSIFHLVCGDFGVFMSYTPEDIKSYVSLNNRASNMMAYDSDASDLNNSIYAALQDRGTRGFEDSELSNTTDLRSTDGLRVIYSNDEKSVWTLMYFGEVYRASNLQKKDRTSLKYFNGNWKGTFMVESPDTNEDAIYMGGFNTLGKLIHDPVTNTIKKEDHPFAFDQTITGFGYSSVNKNNWYVALQNGDFYYSTNSGSTFQKTTYPGLLPIANDQKFNHTRNQHIIKTSANEAGKVYYAGVTPGQKAFLISDDHGQTFTNHIDGLEAYRIRDFAVTEDDKFIFAACADNGPWVYSAEKDKWYRMKNSFIPFVDFTSVEYLPNKNRVVFGTYGSGVLTFDIENNLLSVVENESEQVEPQIIAYPNPTSGKVYLNRFENWQLFSMAQKKIAEGSGKEIDLSSLANGIYFLKVKNKHIKLINR